MWPIALLVTQEQVKLNKDLDLPTQHKLLAHFRCEEIANSALSVFNKQISPVRSLVEAGDIVEGLAGLMDEWNETTLGSS
jgi:protein SEY1